MKLVRLLSLFVPIILLSGCSSDITIGSENSKIETIKNEYQYSAPWDKDLYDSFYNAVPKTSLSESIKGGIIPHHLVAGFMPATFFDSLSSQNPSVVVLIGPNHFSRGGENIITSERDWKTIYGITKVENKLINKLVNQGLAYVDEATMAEEHAIYSIIPFITKSLPKTKVIPFILKNNISKNEMIYLVNGLIGILPDDAVIVSSIDFSHYQTLPVANFHDELSEQVIKNFQYDRLPDLEIDSVPSLYVLLKMMQTYDTQKVVYENHSNSAQLANSPDTKETTSHYSVYFGSGESEYKDIASIMFFGDMMLDRNVKNKIDANSSDYLFEKLAGEENRFFSGMDVVTANLEGPFADFRRDTTKEIAFRFDPKLIPMLQKYNFSLFSIANNHMLDMGRAGLAEARVNLEKAGIDFYGDGYGIGDNAYIIKEVPARNASPDKIGIAGGGGFKFGFVGFNDTYYPLDIEQIKNKIIEAKKQVDFVVVNIHWGAEYKVLDSNQRQQYLAHMMIDNGADVIIGHHPHVIQEMEIYKDKPIFYSLGNFVFDQYFSTETQQGLGVGIIFKKNILSLYILPLQGNNSQVELMPYKQAESVLEQIIDKSRLGDYDINNFNLKINF